MPEKVNAGQSVVDRVIDILRGTTLKDEHRKSIHYYTDLVTQPTKEATVPDVVVPEVILEAATTAVKDLWDCCPAGWNPSQLPRIHSESCIVPTFAQYHLGGFPS